MSDITSGKTEALSNLRRAQISLQSLLMRQDIDHVDRLNWANARSDDENVMHLNGRNKMGKLINPLGGERVVRHKGERE